MFSEVIVPVDGSSESARALGPAGTVAQALEIPLRIVSYHTARDEGFELRRTLKEQMAAFAPVRRTIETAVAVKPVAEHIVDVLDAGVDPQHGVPFLAMELLDGEPLDERLRRTGALAPADTFTVLGHVTEALDQAHEAGVVHRDLKPQNLFITRNRKGELCAKVLDFGIAKVAETVQQSTTQIGTPDSRPA